MIRDQLITGIRDKKLSEQLQLDSRLTLATAIQRARQTEEIKKQQSLINNNSSNNSTASISKLSVKRYGKNLNPHTKANIQKGKCRYCNGSPHPRNHCPARNAICHGCGIKGHYKSACERPRQAKHRNVRIVQAEDAEGIDAFIGAIQTQDKEDKWSISIKVNGKPLMFKLDTGADVTTIPEKWFSQNLKLVKLIPTGKRLFGPDNNRLTVIGKFYPDLTYGERSTPCETYVVKEIDTALLGKVEVETFDVVRRVYHVLDTNSSVDPEREFPELFTGLGKLKSPYHICIKEGTTPYAISAPRRVPIPLMDKLKSELGKMVEQGVIEPVDGPSEWCAPVVIVPKKDGKIRICVDFSVLNQAVQREYHPIPGVEHTLAQLADAKYFSKIDCNSGFWQIPLTPESAPLTTFITPFGRFRFKRLPFGISSAPEHFQKRVESVLEDLSGLVCLYDDVLIHGSTVEEHDDRLRASLTRMLDAGMTLNKSKCKFGVTSIKFLGHSLDQSGVHPDADKVEAISSYPTPTKVDDVRKFMGMINFFGRFIPSLADKAHPLHELLRKQNSWIWGPEQESAFNELKNALKSEPLLAIYDPKKETVLSTDASSFGLGSVLLQKAGTDYKPVAFASRTMNDAEKKYSQIEKEALAIAWAAERFRDFLIGKTFHIETDHKPLVPLLTNSNLNDLTPRLQRIRIRLMRYSYTISHTPGNQLAVADALSRSPLSTTQGDSELEEEVDAYIQLVVKSLPATDNKIQEIIQAQEVDSDCITLKNFVANGWPKNIPPQLRKFWSVREQISVVDGLLMRANRIIIPQSLRREMLDRIHDGHLGISKCRERLKISVWWPGASKDVTRLVTECPRCVEHRENRREPLIPTQLPTRPWEIVGVDLFYLNGRWYVVVVDYFSRFPEIALLESLKSSIVILHLKSMFARHGIPAIVRSDNGSQFQTLSMTEFHQFAKEWGFQHVTSSPHYAPSNGMAEAAVKVVKNRLKKSTDVYSALLAYRTTPLASGYSPSQLLMGRQIRSQLPSCLENLEPKWPNFSTLREREEESRADQKRNFDRRHGTRPLKPLESGETVWITDLNTTGRIIKKAETPRSYVVETSTGRIRRNRFHLIPSPNHGVTEEDSYPLSPYSDDSSVDLLAQDHDSQEKPTDHDCQEKPPDGQQEPTKGLVVTRSGRVIRAPKRLNMYILEQ